MIYYLIHANGGAPALALTFASADDANAACERYFGADAVGNAVLVAGFGDASEASASWAGEPPSRDVWLALAGGGS